MTTSIDPYCGRLPPSACIDETDRTPNMFRGTVNDLDPGSLMIAAVGT